MKYFVAYLILINAAAFLSMLADKRRARKNRWRISEATLLALAAMGGSVGSLLGMYAFRHKTRHLKFTLGVPAILAAQFFTAFWIFSRFYA